ncbi:hypothetical protein [Sphaerochaeta globosa]|uniref:YubB ferredoxin-like domain-containing protein n=1 Tax=Sphaerochaeta globosa (strain ATCC BAA-1886 / DSM 22777 / Buddy) TaxID=158189 RepID=F0RWN4_SPHGB|nr:hypothetical protein [Sphaerochaeta globosa]ADY13665.1 hypothetical protein SpiBuddy_1841 [Sphaerochaeta globosa str. Buddy]
MANWVKTYVKLKGKKEELDKIESMMTLKYGGENYEENQNFFNSLVPMPCMLPELEWLYKHWGTCTEAEELWYDRDDDELIDLAFETGWATPLKIFEAITRHFPSVVFAGYYADENAGFNCGIIFGRKGRVDKLDIGEGRKPHIRFASHVLDMNADGEYFGKSFEALLGRPIPKEFIEVGLGD